MKFLCKVYANTEPSIILSQRADYLEHFLELRGSLTTSFSSVDVLPRDD